MEKYVLRLQMNFSKSSMQSLGVDVLDFALFLSKPKLVIDYAEALIQCRALSYNKARVSNEPIGRLLRENEKADEAISISFRINNIRTPLLIEQYQQLGRSEKRPCTLALIVMIYIAIEKLSDIEKEVLLDGGFDTQAIGGSGNVIPAVENKSNTLPISETGISVVKLTDSKSLGDEETEIKPKMIEECNKDPGIPEAGTDEHEKLFAGMGDMFKESGDVENEGFQHNLSGDEPDIDTM